MRRLLWVLTLLLLSGVPARAGELRAGVARVDITPPVGTPLGGYAGRLGRGSTGVHDPIHAKALVLDDGHTRLAIITTDLVGTNPEMTRRVAEAAKFPPGQLLLCASHTHSGPGAYGKPLFATLTLGAYREKVFDLLATGIARALTGAIEGLQPARLAMGEVPLRGFQRNRRKTGWRDTALWLMRVDTADGKPMGALVNLTAHGTVLDYDNLKMSGDWMAFTQASLEREVPGLTTLYANGAVGDISPNIPPKSSTFEGARAHGELGGKAALELYRSLKPAPEVKLSFKTAPLALPRTDMGKLIGAGDQTTLQILTVNDALLIGVPGEMIAQLGLLLKEHARRQGHAHPVVMGLANDHLGYFLTRSEMKKGGYESTISFFGEGFGEQLTLALAALIGGDVTPVKEGFARPSPAEQRKRNTPAADEPKEPE